ncbi:MAG: biopolymer transporter ExbD [Bacteroidetes bacterium]|jgi:biopolymer transport protein ExbD|nr:MAG: biopolymer transporter ExbD [Bacteroidota bacterium]
MPHVKVAKKSTDTDMTPFVDVAFLILSFFIMATQFKPPEPVPVETPNSVSSDILKEENSMLITVDKDNKVFININEKKGGNTGKLNDVISDISQSRTLNLTPAEMTSFTKAPIIGVPFNQLRGFLDLPHDQQEKQPQPGIPVLDTLNNELVWWIASVKKAFAGQKLLYLVKGDNKSKYPTFEAIINALRKNEEFKYNLVTSQEGAPEGTDLYKERRGIK